MKKLLSLVLALCLTLSLSALAMAETVRIGASPVPHADILKTVVDAMAEKGFELDIVEFTDYVLPNTATESGELDANFFQHRPYLANFNEEQGTHLVEVIPVHLEPMLVFPGKSLSLEDIKDGATIAVPNDPTNEGRALNLLAANGLITLSEDAGFTATKLDIVENPHNLKIEELEAAQVPRALKDVDFAVINVNYALDAGLSPKDAVAVEPTEDNPNVNIVVVKEGNEDAPFVAALREVLNSDAVRTYIEETFEGAVVPAF